MRALALLLVVLLAACGRETDGPVASSLPEPRPALWRVADADTTLYLFGTIHMLPPGTDWRSDAVDEALAASAVIHLEADVEGDPAIQRTLVERLGRLPPPQRLSDLLQPGQRADLIAKAARLGLPMAALDPLRPWLAAVTLADAALRGAGFSSDAGVETSLRREAEAAGKQVRFLETLERQLSALSDLPEDVQLAYLAFTLADLDTAPDSLAAMVNAWLAGDVEGLARLLIADDMARLPALQHALLTRRNVEWVAMLETLLAQETGAHFVAVGAAHLVGDGGLPALMTASGHPAERLQ